MRTTTIPFMGFYESHHDGEIDDVALNFFSDDFGNPNEDAYEEICDKCDWQKVHLAYAKQFTEEFAETFGIKVAFVKVEFPREYNFETDRIFAAIELQEVRRLWKEVPKPILYEKSKERHTSRPGFHSFYDPEFVHNTPLPEWDLNMIGTLLEAYVEWKVESGDVCEDWETDIAATMNENGDIDSWIWEALPNAAELEERYREED